MFGSKNKENKKSAPDETLMIADQLQGDFMVITFKDVSFRYTDKNLLDKVSFSITDQDKTGLVGLNGTGKSTLIKLIEDEIRPQSGEIIKSGNMIISYLEQEPDIPLNTKILDYVMKNNDKDHKVNDYEAKSMLTKLKLDPEALTNNLSGGQRNIGFLF